MSNRKRVNLSLTLEEYETLLRYSNTVDSSPTGIIHSVIQEVLPNLVELTEIALQAQKDKRAAASRVQGMAMQKISELSELSHNLPTGKVD
jgi:hypothetical protein